MGLRGAQWLIAVASLVGFLLSLALFVATFTSRPTLEAAMSDFLRAKVKQEVRRRLGTTVGNGPEELAERFDESGAAIAQFLDEDFDRVVDGVIDGLCGLDCEESQRDYLERWKDVTRTALEKEVADYDVVSKELREYIRGRYLHLVRALLAELRIFSGINAVLFAFVLALLIARRREPRAAMAPAVLLLFATVACAAVYIVDPNWFFAILLQRYPGYWYLVYVAIVFALLIDITFNKGRVTQRLIDAVTSLLAPLP